MSYDIQALYEIKIRFANSSKCCTQKMHKTCRWKPLSKDTRYAKWDYIGLSLWGAGDWGSTRSHQNQKLKLFIYLFIFYLHRLKSTIHSLQKNICLNRPHRHYTRDGMTLEALCDDIQLHPVRYVSENKLTSNLATLTSVLRLAIMVEWFYVAWVGAQKTGVYIGVYCMWCLVIWE